VVQQKLASLKSSWPSDPLVASAPFLRHADALTLDLAALLIPHHVRCASASQVLRMSTIKKEEEHMESPSVFVGINVSKAHLNIALHPSREERVLPHTATSIATLVTDLEAIHPTVIALEPTGGDVWPLTRALLKTMLPVMTVSPSQIRNFAVATGLLSQEALFYTVTGIVEAHVLARFVSTLRSAL
jgi:hypothetical protein